MSIPFWSSNFHTVTDSLFLHSVRIHDRTAEETNSRVSVSLWVSNFYPAIDSLFFIIINFHTVINSLFSIHIHGRFAKRKRKYFTCRYLFDSRIFMLLILLYYDYYYYYNISMYSWKWNFIFLFFFFTQKYR